MTTSTPTLTLRGYLGRDVQTCLTTPREYSRVQYDPVTDGEVEVHGATPLKEYAKLSIAVHRGSGRDRRTTWYELRAWNLDEHPDEGRIRTARKGQRVEVQGHWEVHRYTDRATGEEREFRYVVVTGFRCRPGRLLRAGERS
ncbi:MAG TPA: hypothetical protein VLF66_17680, partial [Thermoanaerobaculia bacterium]|nr:hypothetical protein [Thermoanaerobaculia bacterium]